MAKTIIPTERVRKVSGGWIIPSETGDCELREKLIPSMTQNELTGYNSRGVHSLSMPGYFQSVLGAGYDLREKGGQVEGMRQFLQDTIRNYFPQTLTRGIYMPRGQKDGVVNGYGTQFEKKIEVDLVGEDGPLEKVLSLEASLALTGKNPMEVKEILDWINETRLSNILRLNSKSDSVDVRVARFSACSGRASLYCDGGPSVSYSSLGVRFGAKK